MADKSDADRLERERYGPELGAALARNDGRPRVTEKQFQGTVIEAARLLGWSIYHTFDARRSAQGWPDLALWRSGRFMLRELKTDKGKLSAAQMVTIDGLRDAGVDVGVWRPVDWPRVLDELGGGK